MKGLKLRIRNAADIFDAESVEASQHGQFAGQGSSLCAFIEANAPEPYALWLELTTGDTRVGGYLSAEQVKALKDYLKEAGNEANSIEFYDL